MPYSPDACVSIIVPCFNEQAVLRETHRRLTASLRSLKIDYEIVYVDDGSRDDTPAILRCLQADDDRVRVVSFSRNFGHQVAVTAGLDHAAGDAVVVIDADLQDPPELISTLVARWQEGYEVAYGQRTERQGETLFKRVTASLFYRVLRRLTTISIPPDTGDFRLMDRSVVDALRQMPERDRFLRGMVSWVGFRHVAVPYRREPRFAGTSKYPLARMLRLATDAIISFSPVPPRLATFAGLIALMLAMLTAVAVLSMSIAASSWPSTGAMALLAVLLMGGVQLLTVGLLGEYVVRIYRETQNRPLYILRETRGLTAATPAHRQAA